MKIARSAIAFACLLLGATALQATPILPGQTVIPEQLPNPGDSAVILDDTSGSFSFPLGSGPNLFTGEYEQGVAIDPFGLTCAGCLDFFYRVTVDSNSPGLLFNLGGAGFGGFTTSVGWLLDGDENDDSYAPLDANRSADGVNVIFNFGNANSAANAVPPGKATGYLLVATNATAYDRSGVLGVIGAAPRGGGVAFGLIQGMFAPAVAAVPEPATLALLGAGIGGMFVARRRRKAKLPA